MRITSGKARGISLKSPAGDATRPATDAARQAIFSSLADFIEGAKVVDLFAGTGSYGLEAVSRGASSVNFFESNRRALICLKENIENVKKCLGTLSANVNFKDVFTYKPSESETGADLIFADPPYEYFKQKPEAIFEVLKKFSKPESLIILEAPADFEFSENSGFELIKRLGKSGKGKPSQLILKQKENS